MDYASTVKNRLQKWNCIGTKRVPIEVYLAGSNYGYANIMIIWPKINLYK